MYQSLQQVASVFPVFPCGPDKRPLTRNGFKDAKRGDDGVMLFLPHGNALIGVPTGAISGLVVIDIDPRHGGHEWYAANADALGEPRIHRTMSGGMHLLYEHPGFEVRNSAGKIAPGVDVRGDGGYVIFPPSRGYAVDHDVAPPPLPMWLSVMLRPAEKPAPEPREWRPAPLLGEVSRYAEIALRRECDAIANAADGNKHYAVNKAAFSIGGLVAAGELAEGEAMAALEAALEAIRHRCEDFPHAQRTLRQAFRDGMAEPRDVPERRPSAPAWDAFARAADAATFKDDLNDHPDAEPEDIFPTMTIGEILALPPPQWLIEGLIVEDGVAGLYGPPASLKSFAALGMALSVAHGVPWAGRQTKKAGVLYIAGEGARGMGKRIRAWQDHHGVSDPAAPFRLLSASVAMTDPEVVARLIRTAQTAAKRDGQRIGLVIIDTVARSMAGADENSAQDMGLFIQGCDAVRDACRVAVLGVHHSGKDAERGARGSSAFLGAMDGLLRIKRDENMLEVSVEKQKDAEEGAPFGLEAVPVTFLTASGEEGNSLVLVPRDVPQIASKPAAIPATLKALMRAVDIAIGDYGVPLHPFGPDGALVNAVPIERVREAYYEIRGDEVEYEAKKKGFQRAIKSAVEREIIISRDIADNVMVWLSREN